MIKDLIRLAKKEKNRPYVLIAITSIFLLFLTVFLLDSTLGASLYVGFIWFIAIMSINRKAYKQKNIKKFTCSGELSNE